MRHIKYCNTIYKTLNGKYGRCNNIFIKSFQLFKVLVGNVDELIIPMGLTYEVLTIQFYDKVY